MRIMNIGNKAILSKNYTEYKQRFQYFDVIGEFRKHITTLVARRGLTSAMNDTKWLELQEAINTLSFPPPFTLKCITDPDDYPVHTLEDAPRYLGDWSSFWEEGLPPFINIEWIKVRPRHGIYRGRLIADEVRDETEDFIALLERISIPYDNNNGTITIYGYK